MGGKAPRGRPRLCALAGAAGTSATLTLHQCAIPAAAAVQLPPVAAAQAVIAQALRVTQALQDGVHEALGGKREPVNRGIPSDARPVMLHFRLDYVSHTLR